MEDAKQTARPQYGMGQNVLYMLRTAWRTRKSVIALCAAQALLGVASSAHAQKRDRTVRRAGLARRGELGGGHVLRPGGAGRD